MNKVIVMIFWCVLSIGTAGISQAEESSSKKYSMCTNDEVFITNADDATYSKIGWSTKRKAGVAYATSGKPISDRAWNGSFSVCAKKQEIQDFDPEVLKRLEDEAL
jgi:hypothetical protein